MIIQVLENWSNLYMICLGINNLVNFNGSKFWVVMPLHMSPWINNLMLQPSKILFLGFSDNELEGNAHKSHTDDFTKIEGDSVVKNISCEKLLSIKIDSKLNVSFFDAAK